MRPSTGSPPRRPPLNYLETLSQGNGGLNKATFTLVGYGVFFDKPDGGPQKPVAVSDLTRRFTTAVGQNASSQVLKLPRTRMTLALAAARASVGRVRPQRPFVSSPSQQLRHRRGRCAQRSDRAPRDGPLLSPVRERIP
jgi:hypothetical protein